MMNDISSVNAKPRFQPTRDLRDFSSQVQFSLHDIVLLPVRHREHALRTTYRFISSPGKAVSFDDFLMFRLTSFVKITNSVLWRDNKNLTNASNKMVQLVQV